MAIQDHAKFFQLTAKIWPESIQMDENRRDKAVETIVQLVYLAPFTLAGLIWLIVETDYGFLAENLDRLLILFAAMTLLLLQPFKVRIGNEQRGGVFEVSGSLAPLVMWSALFISGAAGLDGGASSWIAMGKIPYGSRWPRQPSRSDPMSWPPSCWP
jgi:hypothetical protein